MEFTSAAPAANPGVQVDLSNAPSTPEVKEAPVALAPPVEKTDADKQKEMRLAQMVKAKKAQIFQQKQIKAERAALAKEKEEIQAFNAAKQKAKLDPDGYLKAGGLTYEELVQYYLSGKQVSPEAQVSSVRQELEEYKAQMAEEKRLDAERRAAYEQKQLEATVSTYKGNIGKFLQGNAEKYELTNLEGEEAIESMYDLIEENFKRSGKIMSIEEAADIMEDFIEKRITSYQKSKKLSKYFGAKEEEKAPVKDSSGRAPSKTLSNDYTASSAAASVLPAATENDRIKRALAKLGDAR